MSMFSVKKNTQVLPISLFFLFVAKVVRYLMTTQRSSKENNDSEIKIMEEFQPPLDLIVEILKKLPTKSLMKFLCVSKEWSSIITNRRDFIESIMARSLRPPLKLPVFIFHYCSPKTFFTVSSTFSLSTKPIIPLMAESSIYYSFRYQYVRGFICCSSPVDNLVTIYNPTTRQCLPLPKIKPMTQSQTRHCCFGYDHVMNQYKVLALIIDCKELTQTFHVYTLGRDCQQWRKIQGNIDEELFPTGDTGVCIDGSIYYGATRTKERGKSSKVMLLCFEVMSERFYHVSAPKTLSDEYLSYCDRSLFNHMGKCGWIGCKNNNASMWIMENAKKQESSNVITFGLPQNLQGDFRTSGVTPAGEIFVVQSRTYPHNMSLYVYYYNMKHKSFRKVEIEGAPLERRKQYRHDIRVFPIHDYVENTMLL